MVSPEIYQNPEQLRQSVISKAKLLLDDPKECNYTIFEGKGLAHDLALAIRGRTFERLGSLSIGNGYRWVAITERSTKRFGKLKPDYLVLNGDAMADSEGRNVTRLWHFDLYNQVYEPEVYKKLSALLDSSEGPARDELFYRLAEGRRGD